jgi:ribose-phosphate pyrophosphokinase
MKIIGGSASKTIAQDISKLTNASLVPVEIKRFPDGELYIRIQESLTGESVIIIQTTYPDQYIIELFLLIDAVKRAKADQITVVIPYFGYARQDKQFKDGEPVSAQVLAKLISIDVNEIITLDPHKEHILDFFTVPATSISAVDSIADFLRNKHIDFVLAPDEGAIHRAKKAADKLDCDFDYMQKTRVDGSTIKIAPKKIHVKGKNTVIIDDIISTGGTMATSIQELKKQGAKKVYVACTHGLFAGNAIKKLKSAGCEEIIATDSIQSEFGKVKTANAIAEIL